MKYLTYITLTIIISSCSSTKYSNSLPNQSDQRKTIQSSLFGATGDQIPEDKINYILNSQIKYKKKMRVGIFKMETSSNFSSIWFKDNLLDKRNNFMLNNNVVKAINKIKSHPRISDLIIFPRIMSPAHLTIETLRKASVRLQLDALLIIKAQNVINHKFRLFKNDKASVDSSMEALLLDIKTGIIPFTAIANEKKVLEEKDEDYKLKQYFERVSNEVEGKAFHLIIDQAYSFISKVR